MSPLLTSSGPIEAFLRRRAMLAQGMSPLLTSSGPIEASREKACLSVGVRASMVELGCGKLPAQDGAMLCIPCRTRDLRCRTGRLREERYSARASATGDPGSRG